MKAALLIAVAWVAAGPLLSEAADPALLKLDSPADRYAFRRWFAFLAEIQLLTPAARLPREIDDCAGLVRFAYREALRRHDTAWASSLGLDWFPPLPSVTKYQYPNTPFKAGLFQIGPGEYAEFADAKTLRSLNTHNIGRDLRRAETGDLLFYRQLEQNMPYHVMIFLGESVIDADTTGPWLVYHTGPSREDPGEIRRPTLQQLLNHPEPRWRPVNGNSNFLGVYRWNILQD
jgi:uncharacterized protein YfaT (DUF1175 family)